MQGATSPRVTNLVVKFTLDFDITLEFLQFVLEKVDYRPQRFNGAIVKDNGCTLLVFWNGKINVVGAKMMEQAEAAVRRLCELMDQPVNIKEMQLVNLVASASLGKSLNLNKLTESLPTQVSYNPDLYPAAYYTESRSEKPKVLIFHTGKLVFTGFKSIEAVNELYTKLSLLLF